MGVVDSTFRRDIQGLRAVAVGLVWAYHAGLPVPGGFAGVDVFFVISGFVITSSLIREVATTGSVDIRRFVIRRFWRLAPALSLLLVTVMALTPFLVSPLGGGQVRIAQTAIGGAVAAGNVVIKVTTGGYFDAPAGSNPLLHVWSLSVEEQVYLVLPVVSLLMIRRVGRRRAAAIAGGGLVVIGSFLLPILITDRSGLLGAVAGFYSPVSRLWEFAVGVALAFAINRSSPPTGAIRSALDVAGMASILLGAFFFTGSTPWPGVATLLPVLGTAALIASGGEGLLSRMLSSRPMVEVGDRSYAIYLWHWPLIVFADLLWRSAAAPRLIAAVLALPIAVLTFAVVESPLRAIGRESTRRRWRGRASLTIAASPVFAAFIVILGATQGIGPARVVTDRLGDALAAPPEVERRCLTRGPFNRERIDRCTWFSAAPGRPIYLVGDSNAAHFAAAVIELGSSTSSPVEVLATASCPPLLGVVPVHSSPSELVAGGGNPDEFAHCGEFSDFWIERLAVGRPGIVILGWHDEYFWSPSVGLARPDGSVASDTASKELLLEETLTGAVAALQASGHDVVLVQTVPTFRNPPPTWLPAECSYVRLRRDGCGRSVPLEVIDRIQAGSRGAVERTAERTTAVILDFRDEFCPHGTCSPITGGVIRYRDATHLTVATSRSLSERFKELIAAAEG